MAKTALPYYYPNSRMVTIQGSACQTCLASLRISKCLVQPQALTRPTDCKVLPSTRGCAARLGAYGADLRLLVQRR